VTARALPQELREREKPTGQAITTLAQYDLRGIGLGFRRLGRPDYGGPDTERMV
jgi:hypothetical protein